MTNSKTTKRALLSSTLALLMCVAMLIGTTFAWFTDTASTAVNKIQAGTLDIGLEMWDGEKWVTAEGETLNFKAADNRTDILWEPGCTYELPKLRIVNKGNLALKYQVVISGINGDAQLNEAIDWYYSVELTALGGTGWTSLVPGYKLSNFTTGENYLYPQAMATIARPNESVFKIVGKMKETAGNEYQGLSIDGVSITVVATQYNYESDSYNNQYDAGAEYDTEAVTAAELKNILTADGEVVLDKNYIVTDAWTSIKLGAVGMPLSVNIDGQGHTIYNLTDALVACDPNASVTIKNLTISGANILGDTQEETNGLSTAAFVAYSDSNCGIVLDNCHVVNSTIISENYMQGDTLCEPRAAGLVGYVSKSSISTVDTVSITNCSVEDCTITGSNGAAGIIGLANMNAKIEGCTIKGNTAIKCTEDRDHGAAKAGTLVGTVAGSVTVTIKNTTVASTVTLININATPVNDGLVGRIVGGTVVVE